MRKRAIWIEQIDAIKYVVSAETHDGYVYYANSFDELIRLYEEDFNCKVGKVYDITKTR